MQQPKRIVSFTRGNTICRRVVIADRPLRRMRGLLGRRSLPAGEGILLRPEPAIHTAFMRFPIDALFLDADLEVMEIVADLRPWRTAGKRGAHSVLELAAGEAARNGVEVGDRLGVFDGGAADGSVDEAGMDEGQPTEWDFLPIDIAAFRDSDYDLDAIPVEDEDSAREWVFPSHVASDEHADVTRVLLIAHDRRFRTVASALLARRGCAVATSITANRVEALVKRERVDVVVLDAGQLLTEAARTVARLEAMTPPVGVVLVADEAELGLNHLTVLAKWGPFEDIFAAIQRAERQRGHRSGLVG